MRRLKLFLASALTAVTLGGVSQAAPLGVSTEPSPHIDAVGAGALFLIGPDLSLFSGPGIATGALSPYLSPEVTLAADILPDGTVGLFGGGFSAADFGLGPIVTSDTLTDFGFEFDPFGDDTLEFLFDAVVGPEAGHFADGALITLTGEFGASLADMFLAAGTAGIFGFSVNVSPVSPSDTAIIPLPLSGLLLLSGAGGLALVRRRKA